ncbi:hypothetical protein [Stenotrophomonas maltophilia]|uniref:hypothetical protein n=1 Tax=Stenotrophomonas maltophilia TaxID=40324 RepID=UPI000B4C5D15|nr:hypothetical protein [Stenotrophomonas maltophilia]MBH1581431.1 hypothetical protein [Stenotrophomonas maltophilia]OWQ68453.1 hypothetical protein CEE58_01135 [Stenotrophomonas maltophilia]
MPVIRASEGAARVIVVERRGAVAIRDPRTPIVATARPTPVEAIRADTRTVEVAARGAQGPAGPAGTSPEATYPVGQPIHGHRVVRLDNGKAYHPNTAVLEHAQACIGIALQSANSGEVAVRLAGTIEEASWTWRDGAVWCGADGALTQAPGTAGWLLCVGRALNATTLMIDFDSPIARI